MNEGQFHSRSYSFSLNQPLMTLMSKSFSDDYYSKTTITKVQSYRLVDNIRKY